MRSDDVSWPWSAGGTLISQSVCVWVQASNAVCGQVCDVAVYDSGINFSPACLLKQTNWTLVVHSPRPRTTQAGPACTSKQSTTARQTLLLPLWNFPDGRLQTNGVRENGSGLRVDGLWSAAHLHTPLAVGGGGLWPSGSLSPTTLYRKSACCQPPRPHRCEGGHTTTRMCEAILKQHRLEKCHSSFSLAVTNLSGPLHQPCPCRVGGLRWAQEHRNSQMDVWLSGSLALTHGCCL
jgi:hypothetical protein